MRLKRFEDIDKVEEKVNYDYDKLDDKVKEIIDFVDDKLIDKILKKHSSKEKKYRESEINLKGAKLAMKELKNKIIEKLK